MIAALWCNTSCYNHEKDARFAWKGRICYLYGVEYLNKRLRRTAGTAHAPFGRIVYEIYVSSTS